MHADNDNDPRHGEDLDGDYESDCADVIYLEDLEDMGEDGECCGDFVSSVNCRDCPAFYTYNYRGRAA